MLPVALHPFGRNRPHLCLQIDLGPLGAKHLGGSGDCEDGEFKRSGRYAGTLLEFTHEGAKLTVGQGCEMLDRLNFAQLLPARQQLRAGIIAILATLRPRGDHADVQIPLVTSTIRQIRASRGLRCYSSKIHDPPEKGRLSWLPSPN